jgi:hypothetical protein
MFNLQNIISFVPGSIGFAIEPFKLLNHFPIGVLEMGIVMKLEQLWTFSTEIIVISF